jgi:hypothetical protein
MEEIYINQSYSELLSDKLDNQRNFKYRLLELDRERNAIIDLFNLYFEKFLGSDDHLYKHQPFKRTDQARIMQNRMTVVRQKRSVIITELKKIKSEIKILQISNAMKNL